MTSMEINEMSDRGEEKSCACTQKFMDLLRAYTPKKNLLKEVKCAECGKVFWTNYNREYCFDCEEKLTQKSKV